MFRKKILYISLLAVLFLSIFVFTACSSTKNMDMEISEITEKASESYTEYLKYAAYEDSNISPMPFILVELGLVSEEDLIPEDAPYDPSIYFKSTVLYKDFKEAMLKFLSEEYFNKNYSSYKDMDGYVGLCTSAAGIPATDLKSLEFIAEKEGKYYFIANLIDRELYDHFLNPEEGENILEDECYFSNTVTFIEENGRIVLYEN